MQRMGRKVHIQLRKFWLRVSRKHSLAWLLFWVYLGCLGIFSFIGDRGLWTSYQLWKQSNRLAQENRMLKIEIKDLEKDIHLYRHDLRTIEQQAREELHLSGPNEIQYIFKE